MPQQMSIRIEGNRNSSQIGQAMLRALDRMGESAVFRDGESGINEFTKEGIKNRNRGHAPDIEITTKGVH